MKFWGQREGHFLPPDHTSWNLSFVPTYPGHPVSPSGTCKSSGFIQGHSNHSSCSHSTLEVFEGISSRHRAIFFSQAFPWSPVVLIWDILSRKIYEWKPTGSCFFNWSDCLGGDWGLVGLWVTVNLIDFTEPAASARVLCEVRHVSHSIAWTHMPAIRQHGLLNSSWWHHTPSLSEFPFPVWIRDNNDPLVVEVKAELNNCCEIVVGSW